jgi:hypothetical protein
MLIPFETFLYIAMSAFYVKAGLIARSHGHDCGCYFGLAAMHLTMALKKAVPE